MTDRATMYRVTEKTPSGLVSKKGTYLNERLAHDLRRSLQRQHPENTYSVEEIQ